jgi:hypothetical protein
MIVFNFDRLDDFLARLPQRAVNDVFTEYVEPKLTGEVPTQSHKLILQFLGKPDPQSPQLIILHQCAIKIGSKKERDDVIENLKKAFDAGGIRLVQGCINEIFMSIS